MRHVKKKIKIYFLVEEISLTPSFKRGIVYYNVGPMYGKLTLIKLYTITEGASIM